MSSEVSYLGGRVAKRSLPVFEGSPPAEAPLLKRLLLSQGELAQFHGDAPPIRYLAFVELRRGCVRGNHYHRVKEEWIYVSSGEIELSVEDVNSKETAAIRLRTGDLATTPPGIAHALKTIQPGHMVEFSPNPFDAADVCRYPVGQS